MSAKVVGTPAASDAGGGIGGSTGATDNRILRADGAGGATLQSSPLSLTDAGLFVDASGNAFGFANGVGPTFEDGPAAVGAFTFDIQAITTARTVAVPDVAGTMIVGTATATTVGAAGAASALPAAPLGYLTVKLPNGTSVKIPYYTA